MITVKDFRFIDAKIRHELKNNSSIDTKELLKKWDELKITIGGKK